MSRYRSLPTIFLACLFLLATACTGAGDSPGTTDAGSTSTSTTTTPPDDGSTTSTTAPTGGGDDTVVIAETNPPNTFDPIAHSNLNNWFVWQLSYEGLIEVGPDGAIAPLLATEWSADESGLAYTFVLRDGVTFHNGEPLEADDVVYSFERLLSEGIPYAQSRFPTLESMEALDERTVVFHLSAPDSSFLLNLADPFSVANAILNREAGATSSPAIAMIGTGPFQMIEYAPENQLVLARFDDYWRPEIPQVGQVVIQYIPEQLGQVAALQAGQIDLMFPSPESYLALQGDDNVEIVAVPTAQTFQINMGSDEPPLDDVRVRRAIALSIDREAMVASALLGQGQPTGPFPVDHPWAVPLEEQSYYQRDVEAARALLADAGYADGLELSFMWPAGFDAVGDRLGEILQSQLAEAGIELVLEPLETPVWLDRLVTANYHMTWTAPSYFADPRLYILPRQGRQGPTPPELQELLDAVQAAGLDELPDLYRDIQRTQADLVYPFTGLVAKDGYVAFRPDLVAGVEVDFTMSRRMLFRVSSVD